MQQMILENSFDVIISFDENLIITNWNKSAVKQFQLEKDDCINKHLYKIFPSLKSEYSVDIELRMLLNNEHIEMSSLNLKAGGFVNEFKAKLLPIFEDKKVRGGIFIMRQLEIRDNELKKQSNPINDNNKPQEYYKFLFKNISTAVVYVDDKFYFKQGNQSFLGLLKGYSMEELSKLKTEQFTHSKHHERNNNAIKKLMKREVESITYENTFITKTGAEVNTIDNLIGMYDENGRFEGAIVIISDITAVKETEAKLIEANKQLSSFAHKISHDLKEPLNSIHSFSSLLARAVQNNIFPEEKEYLNFIIGGAKRAINFINNILYYSEITENDYKIGEVDLNDVIHIVQQNLSHQIKERQAHIYSDFLPTIFGNQTLLVQMFQNLISNSLRYTNPRQEPYIHISCENVKGSAKIRITDNVKGMGEKDCRLVFKPFYKSESEESRADNFGNSLGLTIVKRIVDFHKADIFVESTIDVGTTIEVGFIN